MAFIQRYQTTVCGGMSFTGNTLGLAKEFDTNNAGTFHSAGAYITLDTTSNVPTYPVIPTAGTTMNWQDNESAANLNIPAGSEVLYAEIIWSGEYWTPNEDLTAFINDPIKFTSPLGVFNINQDPATAIERDFAPRFKWYVRSADVTDIVKNAGNGTYSAGSIVGTLDPLQNGSNYAAWTLAVIYSNPNIPLKYIDFRLGLEVVAGPVTVDTTISGFKTPSSGPIDTRVLFCAYDGDITGLARYNEARFGPDSSSLITLSGPNNPGFHFFSGQINNNLGQLDTTGSYGNFNGNAITQTPTFAMRANWDITNVDGSAGVNNDQTSAFVRVLSVAGPGQPQGDGTAQVALGLVIDTVPTLELEKEVDKALAQVGEKLEYTITINNPSDASALDVIFKDMIPVGTFYIPGSFTVDNNLIPNANPLVGVNIGDINSSASKVVKFEVIIGYGTCGRILVNESSVDFGYSCSDRRESATSNAVETRVELSPPVINASNQCLYEGESFDPLQGVTATDCNGDDLTGIIMIIQNNVNTSVPGLYTVTYEVTSPLSGLTTTKTIYVGIVEKTPRVQAITDMIESIALEETALAHILNAEGEKIQKAVALNPSSKELVEINNSVLKISKSIAKLEMVLQSKLSIFECGLCGPICDFPEDEQPL